MGMRLPFPRGCMCRVSVVVAALDGDDGEDAVWRGAAAAASVVEVAVGNGAGGGLIRSARWLPVRRQRRRWLWWR
jgi:hypothetical protein